METLPELVASSAARFERRRALIIRPGIRTRVWRYGELADVVARAARVLSEAGVERGDRVVIWAVNRPEWVIGFLAVAHLGAVSVPIDVRHAHDFAQRVVARTRARLVLGSRQTADGVRSLGLPIIWIEALPDLARRAEALPAAELKADDLAEIVFTSGTTGEPKGAMISHRNLLASAESVAQVFPVGPDERLLSVLPLSHLFEQGIGLITLLLVGGSIAYPASRQPAMLLRAFRDNRVTVLLIVPQGLHLLDAAIERGVDQHGRRTTVERMHRLARRMPMRLRRLLFWPVLRGLGGRLHTVGVGASALDADVAERWREMGVEVLQGYGATEMSPAVSFTRPGRNRVGTVGEAVPGVEIRVAPDGELLVRGPNRFLGYWEDEAATAAAIDGEGWYHTGDLGELSADGFLTLHGRKKDMLALPDGQKVYPEDVEAVLAADERVTGAAVVGWPPGPNLKVHAVLVLADGAEPGDVVARANASLGAHQQIRGWTRWPDEDLPRTISQKVRKHVVLERLAEVERAAGSRATDQSAAESPAATGALAKAAATPRPGDRPTTPEARLAALAGLVARVAELPEASVTPASRLSSDLNLDSLQRVELLSMVEEELGAFVDDAAVDPEATVAELAALVEAAGTAPRQSGIYGWPLHPLSRAVGLLLQALVVVPLVRACYRVRTRGLEHLDGLEGPLIFTPNHVLHLDNAIILTRLPLRWRWRITIAAAADDIFGNPVQGFLAALMANAFPLERESGVRRSFELLGARLDRGFSLLIFPEGKLTVGGPIQPFKSGIGLVAVDSGLPVVPLRLHVRRMSLVDARRPGAPLRGEVELVFGRPLRFDADTDPVAATEALQAAVEAL
ncbi:MAG TPA: AMP-binding protein [Candidatus Limnocylindrales bacterium]|nr:AMP-binding protein [Candidatus Limnocylindrales bacterium]